MNHFNFYSLSPDEQNNIYDLYKKSYEKSVGNAWNKDKFFDRAEDWNFFGDQTGYVAARLQGSGMYKLAVIGGNPRGILIGLKELSSLNKPTWGMVSNDILPMMTKLGFKTPNSATMNILLRFIPKEVFGGVNFKINSDGSITLNYEDTGEAKKYFVGNQQYFDWLKTQIKDKMNPMKLINILKEVISEAKQVGNLYHYTSIENIKDIVTSQYLRPNEEKQISTSVRANMDSSEFSNTMKDKSVARIMLDGDKISNKYKIRPFANMVGDDFEDLGEEAIVTNGKVFPIMPYLKRIDFFLDKTKENKLKSTINILNKLNIPYEIYKGTPKSNIPYNQSKEGNPENIKLDKKTSFKEYTVFDMYYPGMKTKEIKYGFFDYENELIPNKIIVGVSSKYPDFYIAPAFKKSYDSIWGDVVNLKGEKIHTNIIPIHMYDDPEWREKWKNVYSRAANNKNKFSNDIYDSYVLIPKKEVDV